MRLHKANHVLKAGADALAHTIPRRRFSRREILEFSGEIVDFRPGHMRRPGGIA